MGHNASWFWEQIWHIAYKVKYMQIKYKSAEQKVYIKRIQQQYNRKNNWPISARGAKNKNLQFNFKSTSNGWICKENGLSWCSL